jgi:hypothetical protein
MDDDDQLLFVYGSLMNPAERVMLLGRPVDASPARLPGYAHGRKIECWIYLPTGCATS